LGLYPIPWVLLHLFRTEPGPAGCRRPVLRPVLLPAGQRRLWF